jgi:hypothetical protein
MVDSSYGQSIVDSSWPNFQLPPEDNPIGESADPIIPEVAKTFGIPMASSSVDSGALQNIDLKRVPPIDVMRASLLEVLAKTGNLYEYTINENGELLIYRVGGSSSNIDVYYTVRSSGYIPKDVNVMVTGGKKPDKRITKKFFAIIGKDADGSNYTKWDTTALTSNCRAAGFSSSCTITYKDPLMTTGATSYKDGIDNVFELANVFQSIVGWAWNVEIDKTQINSMVNIVHQSQSSVPVCVAGKDFDFTTTSPKDFPDIGVPRKRKYVSTSGNQLNCVEFEDDPEGAESGKPISVDLNKLMKEDLLYKSVRGDLINKFMGLNQVYVVAIPLAICRGLPKPPLNGKENSPSNTVVFISAPDVVNNIYNLKAGIHYIEQYKGNAIANEDASTFLLQFASNTLPNDYGTYGTGVPFYVDKYSSDLIALVGASQSDGGVGYVSKGSLLPINNDGQGLLIKQVWLQVDLDTPCFVINDPRGYAMKIADTLKVSISPIIIESLPPTIAMNGKIIKQDDGFKDNDPTTIQNFEETEMELANNNMKGRTLSLSLASLVEDREVADLSKYLWNILKEDNGINYTHTCSPTSNPKLGDRGPNGYIINTITYSYTDNGSYLITVVEGSKSYGDFAGLSGGIFHKQVEEVNAIGTIVQHVGNHIDYKVAVDGYGTVAAINCYPGVLDIKDRVNVVIHNNAVEA